MCLQYHPDRRRRRRRRRTRSDPMSRCDHRHSVHICTCSKNQGRRVFGGQPREKGPRDQANMFFRYAQFATPKHCVRVHFGNLAETAGPKTVDTFAAQTIGMVRRRPSLTRCQVTIAALPRGSWSTNDRLRSPINKRGSCRGHNRRIAFDDAATDTSQLSTVLTTAAPVPKFRPSGSPDSDCYSTAQYRRYELRTRITSSFLDRLRFPNRHNNRCATLSLARVDREPTTSALEKFLQTQVPEYRPLARMADGDHSSKSKHGP